MLYYIWSDDSYCTEYEFSAFSYYKKNKSRDYIKLWFNEDIHLLPTFKAALQLL